MEQLTLAENKLLLYPETTGLVLFELTLFELLLKKDISFKSSRANDREKRSNGFLRKERAENYFTKNLIYQPIDTAFLHLPQLQLSGLIRSCNRLFQRDFEHYKKEYVVKKLAEHDLIKDGFYHQFFDKIKLTERGINYRNELGKTLAEQKKTFDALEQLDVTARQLFLLSLGVNVLLLGKSYLTRLTHLDLITLDNPLLHQEDSNSAILAELGEAFDMDILSNTLDYFGGFMQELQWEGSIEAMNAGFELGGMAFDLDMSVLFPDFSGLEFFSIIS